MPRQRVSTPSSALIAILCLCLLALQACGSGGASASNTHQGGNSAATATTAPSGPSGLAGSWWGQEKWDKPLSTTDFWFYQIVDSGPGQLQLKATKCVDPTTTHEYYTDPVSVSYVNGAIASFTLLDVAHQQARYQVSGATISNAIKMNMTEVDVSSSGSNPGPSHVTLLKGSQDAFRAACGTLPSL